MTKDIQKSCFGSNEDDLKILMKQASISENELQDIINSVKDWYQKQPHLPKDPFDDRVFLRFCIVNKFSTQRIKEKMDNYLTARTIIPELFTNRDPFDPKLLKQFANISFFCLPKPTEQNYRIVMAYIHDGDPVSYDPVEYLRLACMTFDMRLHYETTVGDLVVCDMKQAKLGHVIKTTPSLIKKGLFVALKCYGFRIKGIYFMNVPPYANSVINLIKTMVKKKMADRVQIISNLEELYQFIKPEYLPVEFGGKNQAINDVIKNSIKGMQSDFWVKWYKESSEKKTDESKRLDKSGNKYDELLDMAGSFRKLDID